ncbi:unnamed protein product [Symbiodinium sp. CCMP2592]|nr:unnamed protein product [Symbiodinium sp. CCMP2592]
MHGQARVAVAGGALWHSDGEVLRLGGCHVQSHLELQKGGSQELDEILRHLGR